MSIYRQACRHVILRDVKHKLAWSQEMNFERVQIALYKNLRSLKYLRNDICSFLEPARGRQDQFSRSWIKQIECCQVCLEWLEWDFQRSIPLFGFLELHTCGSSSSDMQVINVTGYQWKNTHSWQCKANSVLVSRNTQTLSLQHA